MTGAVGQAFPADITVFLMGMAQFTLTILRMPLDMMIVMVLVLVMLMTTSTGITVFVMMVVVVMVMATPTGITVFMMMAVLVVFLVMMVMAAAAVFTVFMMMVVVVMVMAAAAVFTVFMMMVVVVMILSSRFKGCPATAAGSDGYPGFYGFRCFLNIRQKSVRVLGSNPELFCGESQNCFLNSRNLCDFPFDFGCAVGTVDVVDQINFSCHNGFLLYKYRIAQKRNLS